MSVLIHFSLFPTDKERVSVPMWPNPADHSGERTPPQVGPHEHGLEGEWDEVMAVVERCFKELRKDSSRIYMTLQMDYREGAVNRIEGKIKSVEEKL